MNKLKKLRNQRGISLRLLSAEVGIAFSTLSEMENGIRPMAPKHAKVLAPFFGVTEEFIMGDDAVKVNVRIKPSTSIRAYDFIENKWKDLSPSELERLSSSKSIDENTKLIFLITEVIASSELTREDLIKIHEYTGSILINRLKED